MEQLYFLLLFLFMQVNHLNSQLATGNIEEFFIEHNAYDRRIQIYYPFNNQVDQNTKFVIMAGGLGKRLLPLTKKNPKALIKIFNKPMIEHIIIRAKKFGFHNFILSINYLGSHIKIRP